MNPIYFIKHQDIRDFLVDAPENYFHALLGDFPYNLESISKRFGAKDAAPAQPGEDGAFERQTRGFMGKTWDTDVAFDVEVWRDFRRTLRPGAISLGFNHARTFDLLCSAMREADFILESALGWIYATGKPMGTKHPDYPGWEYGNPMRPALEWITNAHSPHTEKTTKQNVSKWGTGLYNIAATKQWMVNGNYPATYLLSHHPECLQSGFKTVKNRSGSTKGTESSPAHKYVYGNMPRRSEYKASPTKEIPVYNCHPDCRLKNHRKRGFYLQTDWRYERYEMLPTFYSNKVQPKERNAFLQGLVKKTDRQRLNPGGMSNDPKWETTQQENTHATLKPIMLTMWLAMLVLPPPSFAPRRIIIPCSGAGSEGIGALLAGWDEVWMIELEEESVEIANHRVAGWLNMFEKGITSPKKILKQYEIESSGQLSLI